MRKTVKKNEKNSNKHNEISIKCLNDNQKGAAKYQPPSHCSQQLNLEQRQRPGCPAQPLRRLIQ